MHWLASGRKRPVARRVRPVMAFFLVAAVGCNRAPSADRADGTGASVPTPATPTASAQPVAPDRTPPTQPQNLDAKGSPDAVLLTWTGSSDGVGVEGYDVFRDEQRIASVSERHLRDGELRAGQRYCYTVVAFDAAGNRSQPSAPACVVVPDVTPPSAPSRLAAVVAADGIQLRWAPPTDDVGVTGYEILGGEQVMAKSVEPSALVAAPAAGQRRCYLVRALDGAGNRSRPSEPVCLVGPDVTPPSTPKQLTVEAMPARVELRWEAATDDVGVVAYEVFRDDAVVAKVAGTSAAEAGLHAAVRYCYAVRALDAAGNRSGLTAPACGTLPDVTPPTTPRALTAHAEGETVVALGWEASTDDVGVVQYEVLREGAVVARPVTPGAKVSGLRAAVEYCHAVRACDGARNCSEPTRPVCVTTPDLTPPTQPAHVVATADSDRAVTVRWSPSQDNVGVVHYQVRRGGTTTVVADGQATSVQDEGLSPATRYCYVVVAEDAAGNASAPSAPACAVTPDLTPPTVPESVAAAPRSRSEIVLAWDRSTDDVGVAGYEILRDGAVVAKVERTQATVASLAPDTQYCHAIRAFDAAGNRSKPSAPKCARSAPRETPSAPWNLSLESTSKQELVLYWDPSSDSNVVYVVYWDTKHGEKPIATTPARSFKIFGKAASERHCYRVSAQDPELHESPRTFAVCGALGRSRTAANDTPPSAVSTSAR